MHVLPPVVIASLWQPQSSHTQDKAMHFKVMKWSSWEQAL